MRTSSAHAEQRYHIEDGDVGYAGDTHASFVVRQTQRVAHIRATPIGAAALDRIYRMLRDRRAGRGR